MATSSRYADLEQALQQLKLSPDKLKIRRTSSRFCLGIEHGDYNGTELFGVGTDRFIWVSYAENHTGKLRLLSTNFPDDGVLEIDPTQLPDRKAVADSWARFPAGVLSILQQEGYPVRQGFDAAVVGNIPGGGMSRSASLAINLLLTVAEVNGFEYESGLRVVELAQRVENDYIGSPCGILDQVMIYFAKAGMGTRFNPADKSVEHVPLGGDPDLFRLVSLDTGTVRHGLEKSTYKIRREECEKLVELCQPEFGLKNLGAVKSQDVYDGIISRFGQSHPHLCARLRYLFGAQQRFERMMKAWREGDIETVGAIFRKDGRSLRDDYQISGPELESMCDIARTVPGVLGERMLGGGDKGASGAIVRTDAVDALKEAVKCGYPRSRPEMAERYATHACSMVDGVSTLTWDDLKPEDLD
ncbi:MAG: hypothetical protein E1N59_2435 [Puniceicoccaceae bacterium 5H]|nr:MAG: hypothetical protein E1N59_2435 [Puniceicoccaceae bacterium 5H]